MFSGALAENIVKAESLHGVKNNWAYIQVKMPTYNYYMKSKKQPHLAWENINNKSWVPGRILWATNIIWSLWFYTLSSYLLHLFTFVNLTFLIKVLSPPG